MATRKEFDLWKPELTDLAGVVLFSQRLQLFPKSRFRLEEVQMRHRLFYLAVVVSIMMGVSCARSPAQPTETSVRVPEMQNPQMVEPPATIAEARQRQAEIRIPGLDGLESLLQDLLAKNSEPTEQEVLAVLWPRLTRQSGLTQEQGVSRPAYISPFSLTSQEFWLLAAYPKHVSKTRAAVQDSVNEAQRQFPGNQTDTMADAFRHAYWNELLSKRIALWWAIAYTDAHESSNPNDLAKLMDLNNNAVGQNIFLANQSRSESELSTITKKWSYSFVTSLRVGERRRELVYFRK